jgi:dienelactone hydrolase
MGEVEDWIMTNARKSTLSALIFLVALILPAITVAAIKTKTIAYKDGDQALQGLLAWDDEQKGKRPGVLVVYEWWGHTKESEERAKRVASAGYVAFVPDMYGDGRSTGDPKQAKSWMMGIVSDQAKWLRRAQLGLDLLKAESNVDGDNLAVLGSSFGGATALQMAYAGHDVKAAVSIASSLPVVPEGVTSIKPRILVFNGRADKFVKPEKVDAFKAGLDRTDADWEMTTYSNAVHSFATPVAYMHGIGNFKFNAMADRRAWVATLSMFEEVFSVTEAERISGDVVRAIISGNTIDLEVPGKGTARAYLGADGTVTRKMGDAMAQGAWKINGDDALCVQYAGTDERCGTVAYNGDGTYTRLDDAGTTFIWKAISEGNVL